MAEEMIEEFETYILNLEEVFRRFDKVIKARKKYFENSK